MNTSSPKRERERDENFCIWPTILKSDKEVSFVKVDLCFQGIDTFGKNRQAARLRKIKTLTQCSVKVKMTKPSKAKYLEKTSSSMVERLTVENLVINYNSSAFGKLSRWEFVVRGK